MEFIKAKSILTPIKHGDEWFGVDYNMNLYRGCPHGCIYCDSRSACYQIDNFDKIRGKENALFILERELSKKRLRGVVGIGAMSDTYNLQEKKYELTRGALKLILKYGYGVSIDTKSDLILQDIDLLQEINKTNNVIIKITITTPNDELSKIIEPNVCVSSKRFATIKKLSDAGLYVGIIMSPVLPFITDKENDIKKLVRLAYEHGAKFIYTYMGMTLRENQRDYYYEKLDKHFPFLSKKYQEYYENKYNCIVPNANYLSEIFILECEKYGILYKMNDIIKAYKKYDEQISLF